MKHPEYELQVAVCDYLKAQYPRVEFMSDTIAAVKLTVGQARRNKRVQKDGFKTPDLIIFRPGNGGEVLFIELKSESPYRKDGHLKSDAHIEAQLETGFRLIANGYAFHFAWTFGQAQKIIDEYLAVKAIRP
jgi:hypothetical protein